MTLQLDRIEIEDAGPDPVRLARALLTQLPDIDGRVPIDAIALALDILAIEIAPLEGIEACLQCDRQKSHGQIVLRAGRSPQRHRYSIGHELGHFLNERHAPTGSAGFDCTTRDMAHPIRNGRHLQQEREANTFAIEVLAPRHLLDRHLRPLPDLARALELAERFDISRAAATRRYVDLHRDCLAVVFSRNGRVLYIDKPKDFPKTVPWTGDPIPSHSPNQANGTLLTSLDQVDPEAWLTRPGGTMLYAQTLYQRDGHATTLLVAENQDGDLDLDGDPVELADPVLRRSSRKR